MDYFSIVIFIILSSTILIMLYYLLLKIIRDYRKINELTSTDEVLQVPPIDNETKVSQQNTIPSTRGIQVDSLIEDIIIINPDI